MKTLLCATVLAAISFPFVAEAEPLPPGKYRKSCLFPYVVKDKLHATCTRKNGDLNSEAALQLNYENPSQPIRNDDGELRFEGD